jgi:hypothetical protein
MKVIYNLYMIYLTIFVFTKIYRRMMGSEVVDWTKSWSTLRTFLLICLWRLRKSTEDFRITEIRV